MTDVEIKLVGMSNDIDFDSGDSLEFLILSINDMRFRAMITEEVAGRIRRVVGLGVAPAPAPAPPARTQVNVGSSSAPLDYMSVTSDADNYMNLGASSSSDNVEEDVEDGAQVD